MEDKIPKEDSSLEEKLEKELYGEIKSERLGKVKKIWGRKLKSPAQEEDWQQQLEEASLFPFFKFNLKKIFIISFLLFLVSVGIFSFIFYYRSIYLKGINIEIIGPIEVNSLQNYEYSIKITNGSNYEINEVKAIIKLDEGIYSFDNPEENKIVYNLGNFQSKESKEIKVKLFFLANVGKNLNLNVELYYLSPKKNQSFSLTKNLLITVNKEPILFQVFAPNQIFTNEPFLLSLKFTNIAEATYDLNLSLETNPRIEALVIEPPPTYGLEWQFNQIKINQPEEINITAKITHPVNNALISFKPEIIYRNKKFALKTYNLTLNIIESPIRLFITSNPSDYLVELNKYLTYEITWENKSKISLENVQVKVYLSGDFNFESINTDGYFSPVENSIIWNARNKPELISIQPGNKNSVRFTIKTVNNYPAGKKDLTLITKAVLETESIPPEVQILSKKLTVETQETKIIPGEIKIEPKITYDKYFSNSGPFPLVKGQQTTLSAYFNICSFGEDFQNVMIKGKIPLGVSLTGNFDLNFDTNNLQFNPDTGEFSYLINDLSYGYCDVYPPYQIAFQISVTPPLYGDIRDFVVLPEFNITAQGKFSQKIFEIKTRPITVLNIK